MDNNEALKLLHNLEDLIKKDDKQAIYEMMSQDFKSRVSLEYYLRLDKYRLNLSLPLCLVDIYESHKGKIMIRVKQESKGNRDIFANMLFVREDNIWKLSGVLI